MSREVNVEIFLDTERLVKTNDKIKDSVAKSLAGQKLITEKDNISSMNLDKYGDNARVVVSSKRSFEAAAAYKGMKTAVHNFASASNPGGGVEWGASAQEECLCRCSGLYFCLEAPEMLNGFYYPHRNAHDPIHNDDIIFTPDVLVFKSDTASPKLMPEENWYQADIITCAAPNLRENPGNSYNSGDGDSRAMVSDEKLQQIHEKRLRRILDVAASEGDECVILGAFGCGAFCNNPEVVAAAARSVIRDYLKTFRVIEFAVYCSPRDDSNFKAFDRVMKEL